MLPSTCKDHVSNQKHGWHYWLPLPQKYYCTYSSTTNLVKTYNYWLSKSGVHRLPQSGNSLNVQFDLRHLPLLSREYKTYHSEGNFPFQNCLIWHLERSLLCLENIHLSRPENINPPVNLLTRWMTTVHYQYLCHALLCAPYITRLWYFKVSY